MRSALRLLGNLVRIGLWPLWLLSRNLRRPRSPWIEIRLSADPTEVAGPAPLWQRFARRGSKASMGSILELQRLATLIADDPRVDGALFHLPHLRAGWATCTSLRDVLSGMRARGKRVVVYLPQGGGNRELYVAFAADRILVSPQAPLALTGVSSQTVYFRSLLERLGLEAEVHARGEYKSAGEPALLDAMSEPQREQMSALIDGIQSELERALAARPGFDLEQARALFERGVFGTQAAREARVVDACCYEDELLEHAGGSQAASRPPVPASRYRAWRAQRLWRRVRRQPAIAVVPLHGAIAYAPRSLPGSRVASVEPLLNALRRARKSRFVHGVLLYVDSPGGSAHASDVIHRELVRLRETKPLVAYFGDVAASGGYYVAAPCARIVAQPTTMTGSIGVVSLRLMAMTLAERLGLRPQTVRGAPHADIGSPFRPHDAHEHALLWAETDAIYSSFVEVVAEGRKRTKEEIERVARGRVWSGRDAAHNGLVDELGGLDRALAALREASPALRGLAEDDVALVLVPSAGREPPQPPARAAALQPWLAWLPSEIGDVLELFGGGERLLYYASLPHFF